MLSSQAIEAGSETMAASCLAARRLAAISARFSAEDLPA